MVNNGSLDQVAQDLLLSLNELPIHQKLGIVFDKITEEETLAHMLLGGNEQIYGSIHGGALAVLAESTAGAACTYYTRTQEKFQSTENEFVSVGTNLTLNYLKKISPKEAGQDQVFAICRPVHLGFTSAVYEVEAHCLPKNKSPHCIAIVTQRILLVDR